MNGSLFCLSHTAIHNSANDLTLFHRSTGGAKERSDAPPKTDKKKLLKVDVDNAGFEKNVFANVL